ncbi:hypothetical protein B0A49_06207 [Cryomyces minteri]|nr:hypothetical protein B0A49_06207 [Cryomyces minteri]
MEIINGSSNLGVNAIRGQLRRLPMYLDAAAGAAIGQLAVLLGLNLSSDEGAIADLVESLIQGWHINSDGRKAIAPATNAFAQALHDASEHPLTRRTELVERAMRAFVDGVDRAFDDLYWPRGAAGQKLTAKTARAVLPAPPRRLRSVTVVKTKRARVGLGR